MDGGDLIMDLKTFIILCIFVFGIRRNSFLGLISFVILYGYEFWGNNISIESWRKILKIQNHLITSHLKMKGNASYRILFIKVMLSLLKGWL